MTIHSVAVDRIPDLPIERRTLFHWAIAATWNGNFFHTT